jgi:hypothetical protein
MDQGVWRSEVAVLLEQCAKLLIARQDIQAVATFGTAVAYLQRAADEGERSAAVLLEQAQHSRSVDRTKRFSFVPGELEELTGHRVSR